MSERLTDERAFEDDPVAMALGLTPVKPGVRLPGTPEHCHLCALDEIDRLRAERLTGLLPAERIALTVAARTVLRGDMPGENTSATCILALGRITGLLRVTVDGWHEFVDGAP